MRIAYPLWLFRIMRLAMPWITRQRGGWRIRQWLLSARKSPCIWNQARVTLSLGNDIWINPNDSMARWILADGLWEAGLARDFAQRVSPGDTVLDVGANAGQYAVIAAGIVGSEGRVYAVEIHPDCLALLRRNALLVLPSRIEILPVAAWDQDTEVRFDAGNADVSGLASVCPDGSGKVAVAARRLDGLLASRGCTHVDVVKLDIEGAELPALRGMENLFRTAPPRAVYCEIEESHCHKFGYAPEDVFAFMETFGYQAYAWLKSSETWQLRADGVLPQEAYGNMFLFLNR